MESGFLVTLSTTNKYFTFFVFVLCVCNINNFGVFQYTLKRNISFAAKNIYKKHVCFIDFSRNFSFTPLNVRVCVCVCVCVCVFGFCYFFILFFVYSSLFIHVHKCLLFGCLLAVAGKWYFCQIKTIANC